MDPYPKGSQRFRAACGRQRAVSPLKVLAVRQARSAHAAMSKLGDGRAGSAHATMSKLGDGQSFGIGDIVRRSDINVRNHYVIVDIKDPWIYTRRISGSGGPGIVTFPTSLMLAKVNP
jgi:hypothetical protein